MTPAFELGVGLEDRELASRYLSRKCCSQAMLETIAVVVCLNGDHWIDDRVEENQYDASVSDCDSSSIDIWTTRAAVSA